MADPFLGYRYRQQRMREQIGNAIRNGWAAAVAANEIANQGNEIYARARDVVMFAQEAASNALPGSDNTGSGELSPVPFRGYHHRTPERDARRPVSEVTTPRVQQTPRTPGRSTWRDQFRRVYYPTNRHYRKIQHGWLSKFNKLDRSKQRKRKRTNRRKA